MVLFSAMGMWYLVHGAVAWHRGQQWASLGGGKSGPMTPGMEIAIGMMFFVAVGAAARGRKDVGD